MERPPIDPNPIGFPVEFPDSAHHRQEASYQITPQVQGCSKAWFAAHIRGPVFASPEEIAKTLHDAANEAIRRGNEKLGTNKPTVRWEDADEFVKQGRLFMAQFLLKHFEVTVPYADTGN